MKTKHSLVIFTTKDIELGIEVKNTIDDIVNFIEPHGLFFSKIEDKFDCAIKNMVLKDNTVVFTVENLDSRYYTNILFDIKNILDQSLETARLYFKRI